MTRKRELAWVLLGALAIALAWTWPLASRLTEVLPYDARFTPSSRGSDTHQYVWNLWWVGEALSGARNPFECPLIFHPHGHSLALHTHAFADGVLAWPLRALFGLPAAFNLTLIAQLAAALAAAYGLGRMLRLPPAAAALLAFGWACSPYFAQKSLEHLSYAAHPWAPLMWLALLGWRRAPDDVRARLWALCAGVAAGLGVLTDPIGGAWQALLGLLVGGFALGSAPALAQRARWSGVWLVPTAFLLVCAPYLRALVAELASLARASGPDLLGRGQLYHARLADFFAPAGLHPLVDGLGAGAPLANHAWDGARPETSALCVGYALLGLAVLACALRSDARRLVWVALPLWLLCWDPGPDPEGWLSSLYRALPLGEALRVPARAFSAFHLALCVAAGMGAASLLARRHGVRWLGLVAALALFEWVHVPLTTARWNVPRAVSAIARETGSGAVCVLPFRPGAYASMSWQTVHGKPVTWSYVARTNPAVLERWRIEAPQLFAFALGEVSPEPAALAAELTRLDVEHVLVPLDELADPRLVADVLDRMPAWTRQQDDGAIGWWRRDRYRDR